MRYLLPAAMLFGIVGSYRTTFARERPLELKSADQPLTAPLNIESLNRLTRVALTGTPSELGGFVPAFDRHLDTRYRARDAGAATLTLAFRDPQLLHGLTLYPGAGRYRWSAAVADSIADLDGRSNSFHELVPERAAGGIGTGDEVKLAKVETVKAIRINIVPEVKESRVEVRDLMLVAEQRLEAIAVESPSRAAPVGDRFPLTVTGFFSGGETRELAGSGLEWTVNPPTAARIDRNNHLVARRRGSFSVNVRYGDFTSAPLVLAGVEAD